MSPQALFIINPVARGLPAPGRLQEAAAWLQRQGWQVQLAATEGQGHATSLAREAAGRGYALVVACGGDGTINEVVNGLIGSETALAVIPGGTANVWAKEVGIPRDPLKAIAIAHWGESRRIDLGRAGERHFLLMAGLGFDGHVIQCLSPAAKERWGALAYVLTGLREGLRYRGQEAHIALEGEALTVDLLFMVVGNTRNYGGVVEITPHARADDGLLDICLFSGRGPLQSLGHLLRVLTRSHVGAPGVFYGRARRVEVTSSRPIPVQVDGEACATTPIVIEARPRALAVKLPPGGGQRLLSP